MTYPLCADAPSPFDLRWSAVYPVPALPALRQLTNPHNGSFLGPVKNQGAEGSCTAESGAGLVEFLARKYRQEAPVLSPAFLYQAERTLAGTLTQDSGVQLRYTQAALLQVGVCPEAADPYTPADFIVPVTPALLEAAAAYKIRRGLWAPTLPEILHAILSGYAVQLGIVVYPSFEAPLVAATGRVPMPGDTEAPIGGHAVIGYDINWIAECVVCRNSWGAAWGLGGDFWLPFGYLQAPWLLSARVYQF